MTDTISGEMNGVDFSTLSRWRRFLLHQLANMMWLVCGSPPLKEDEDDRCD